MSIAPLHTAFAYPNGATGARIAVPDGQEFARTLTIGQMIKGRVLLQYDSGRYLVAFDGRERVVDSSVPLRTGDLLRGRVVALGDRVEIERMPDEPGDAKSMQEAVQTSAIPEIRTQVDAFFARYAAHLPPEGRDLLIRMLNRMADPNLLLLSAVSLAKLGLPQNQQMLQAVLAALKSIPQNNSAQVPEKVATLGAGPEMVTQVRDLVRQALSTPSGGLELTNLAQSDEASVSPQEQQGEGMQGESGKWPSGEIGNHILNAQSGGSISHRIGTLPLIVSDRLVEVSVAVFEQGRDTRQGSATQHRALVFVLHLDRLGLVEVSCTVTGDRLRIRIGAQNPESSTWMSGNSGALQEALLSAGWSVDEIVYEILEARDSNVAVRSIVEHVIAQDSVNRLV
jgi:uncharacterized membrane protein